MSRPKTPPDHRAHREKVGARIRQERERLELSQESLALSASLTQQALAKIEAGEKPLPVDVLSRLCSAFARFHATRVRNQILDIDSDQVAA